MRLSDVWIDPDDPFRVQGKDYIDEMSILCCVGKNERQVLVQRTYHKITERIAYARVLPVWLQFAKARQGSE